MLFLGASVVVTPNKEIVAVRSVPQLDGHLEGSDGVAECVVAGDQLREPVRGTRHVACTQGKYFEEIGFCGKRSAITRARCEGFMNATFVVRIDHQFEQCSARCGV